MKLFCMDILINARNMTTHLFMFSVPAPNANSEIEPGDVGRCTAPHRKIEVCRSAGCTTPGKANNIAKSDNTNRLAVDLAPKRQLWERTTG